MELLHKQDECCGCGECVYICPKGAISMTINQDGFLYPLIDKTNCIECGACQRKCAYKSQDKCVSKETSVYAAVNRNNDDLNRSASGGAFSALARWALDNGWVVCGAAWDDNLQAHHILIESINDIPLLQGSKYVNSSLDDALMEVRQKIKEGRYVLFSGTPCQCDAVRAFIGNCDNLVTVEIICHGTPNAKVFREHIDVLEKKLGGKIVDVQFRDKKCGWGALMKVVYTFNNKTKVKYYKPEESYYYYYYFYHGAFMRSSCYSCKYATEQRLSDFTIGDFWGASKYVPEYDSYKGVSVLIATGSKAQKMLLELAGYLKLTQISLDNVKIENGQLSRASVLKPEAEKAWNQLSKLGPEEFDKYYIKTHTSQIMKAKIKKSIPGFVRRGIRGLLK